MVTVEKALTQRLRSRRFRELSREIISAQEKLRKAVSARAWRAYLNLEELMGARDDATIAAAIRLAFRAGQRELLADVVRRLGIE